MQFGSPTATGSPDWLFIMNELRALLAELDEEAAASPFVGSLLDGELEDIEAMLDNARRYARRLSADSASAPNGHVFVNGRHLELDDGVLGNIQMVGTQMAQYLQEQVCWLLVAFCVGLG